MVKYFRLYLTGVLMLFTLIFSIAIGVYDYYKGQQQILLNHENKIEMIEDSVMQSIQTLDQMYKLIDDTLGNQMKDKMDVLLEKYEQDEVFQNWDFQKLKDQFDMDIYIINEENTVIFSSLEEDIGLNFEECCGSFSKVIENRRLNGVFKHDGLDLHQATRKFKKFAYMPTPDQKYLFELSMSLEDDKVHENFNILEKMAQLEEEYQPIQSIRLYNPTGLAFGHYNDIKDNSVEIQAVFQETKRMNEKKELTKSVNGTNRTYRYIPYVMTFEEDYPMERIIEIVYNEAELEGILKFYNEEFIYQQLIIVFAVILLAIIIGKIISKPIHLAFHDSLTGLKNRIAVEVECSKRIGRADKDLSLMMIDVDNFKQVNDQLGHLRGDQLLIDIATAINRNVPPNTMVARLGGDEFLVIFSSREKEEMIEQAERLLQSVNDVYEELNKQHRHQVSISIGIAYARKEDDYQALYDRADRALYQAKRSGKNQYAFYEDKDVD